MLSWSRQSLDFGHFERSLLDVPHLLPHELSMPCNALVKASTDHTHSFFKGSLASCMFTFVVRTHESLLRVPRLSQLVPTCPSGPTCRADITLTSKHAARSDESIWVPDATARKDDVPKRRLTASANMEGLKLRTQQYRCLPRYALLDDALTRPTWRHQK